MTTRFIKQLCMLTVLMIGLVSLISLSGCGGGKKEVTPEKKEEMRQKMIKNADRERRES